MIILPDRNIPVAKFLMPLHDREWRTPSLSQTKDQFGNENVTKFSISAKSNDGVVIWTGWFDDRSDFDAFLCAIALGTLKQERALWDLPTPNWQPYLGELITYNFTTTTFLTSPTNTNQSYAMPGDWNPENNNIQAIGGGGSGGITYQAASGRASGGGGGAWNRTNNVPISRGSIAYYNIGSGGASRSNISTSAGNNGNDTWFSVNNSAPASTSQGVLAKAGLAGAGTSAGTTNGGSGGTGSSGIGSSSFNGGKGGDVGHNLSAAGGGGAGGPNGNGNAGTNTTASSSATVGGSGGAGSGGAGTAGVYNATGAASSSAGGNGADIQASPAFGSGGGSGGASGGSSTSVSGAGGLYGGGSGGSRGGSSSSGSTSGTGGQGLIIITYVPFIAKGTFNMPNLGM